MKHVIALSGGKDSTALALRLAEVEPRDYIYICTPTGDEPPELEAHWRNLEVLLGKPITYLSSGETLHTLIESMKLLPSFRMRWCTGILKIEPCVKFLEDNMPATLYVGLRADEEDRKGGVYEDVPQRYPMREWGWTECDVWEYLHQRKVVIPKRTDCLRCPYQRLIEWRQFWLEHPEEYERAVQQEKFVSEFRGKNVTFRSPSRDTWPASLEDLRKRFEAGDVPRTRNIGGKCRICSM